MGNRAQLSKTVFQAQAGSAGGTGAFRYDYYIIWSPGLPFRDQIVELIGSEEKFEIVEICEHCPFDLEAFALEVYKLDTIPNHLIHLKTQNMKGMGSELGAEMVIVFLKHHNPDFETFDRFDGIGQISKSMFAECFKRDIRAKFATEIDAQQKYKNVLHGSDYEEQVDHLLKMLGAEEGIEYLYTRYGKPDPIPGTFGHSNCAPV